MSLSIYQSVVPNYLQILGALDNLVSKAEAHCKTKGIPDTEILNASLAPDMFTFRQQIHQALSHSLRAIKAVQEGTFAPDLSDAPESFAALHTALQTTISELQSLDENTLNSVAGKPMRFEFGEYKMNFVAEEFLLTFTQPNFYFHATTAYAILRAQGLELGKGDFMGAMRMVG